MTISQFLQTIHPGNPIFELRGLSPDGTYSLLTRDYALAERVAAAMEAKGADVYYSLNPIDPDSGYVARRKMDYPAFPARLTSRDTDILQRDNLLIDIDPVRPPGEASSNGQLRRAAEVAAAVRDHLAKKGWPAPIVLCSGNGFHLLYRCNLVTLTGREWALALRALNHLFGGDCKIDSAVSNLARISRLPGTLNRKANRRSKIVSVPDSYDIVNPALVLFLATAGGFDPQRAEQQQMDLVIDEEGVEELIEEFPDQLILDRVSHDGDRTYFALAECPFKGEPHRGQDVGKGKTTIVLGPDRIGFSCFSDDCSDHTFGDLLRLLHGETGRWPSVQIWDDDDLDERWPDMDPFHGESDPLRVHLDSYVSGGWDRLYRDQIEEFVSEGTSSKLLPSWMTSSDISAFGIESIASNWLIRPSWDDPQYAPHRNDYESITAQERLQRCDHLGGLIASVHARATSNPR